MNRAWQEQLIVHQLGQPAKAQSSIKGERADIAYFLDCISSGPDD